MTIGKRSQQNFKALLDHLPGSVMAEELGVVHTAWQKAVTGLSRLDLHSANQDPNIADLTKTDFQGGAAGSCCQSTCWSLQVNTIDSVFWVV